MDEIFMNILQYKKEKVKNLVIFCRVYIWFRISMLCFKEKYLSIPMRDQSLALNEP